VDLLKIIHDLREERRKLDLIITSLEQLEVSPPPKQSGPSRRGRRFMDAEGRMEVSRRMKKYWENRRKQEPVEADQSNGHPSASLVSA
jgi:hypothetical protein